MESQQLANLLVSGLARMAIVIDDQQRSIAAERTLAQQWILLVLARRAGAYPLSGLSADLSMSTQATLKEVTSLVSQGLVTLKPAPSYSPAEAVVEPTDAGRAAGTEPGNWAADLLGELDRLEAPDRRRLLEAIVERIADLQRRDEVPIARMCLNCRFFEPYRHPEGTAPHHCWLVDAPFGNLDLRLRCPEQQPRQ